MIVITENVLTLHCTAQEHDPGAADSVIPTTARKQQAGCLTTHQAEAEFPLLWAIGVNPAQGLIGGGPGADCLRCVTWASQHAGAAACCLLLLLCVFLGAYPWHAMSMRLPMDSTTLTQGC